MINELKAYIEQNNLHDKAIEYFWAAFNNWKHDHSEDFEKKFKDIPIDSINVFVHSIGLRSSEWPDCDYNHVTINVKVHYDNHAFVDYIVWFSLSDDVDDDDFLEIY